MEKKLLREKIIEFYSKSDTMSTLTTQTTEAPLEKNPQGSNNYSTYPT
jgi:hypothetical protein